MLGELCFFSNYIYLIHDFDISAADHREARTRAILHDACSHAATLELLDALAPESQLTIPMLTLGGDRSARECESGRY